MTVSDKLKIDILKEFMAFEEKTNIQFDENTDFQNEIISAESLNELENIRGDLNYNACFAMLESCKDIIDYYSKLFTDTEIITKYNDELSEYVEKIDSVDKRTSVPNYTQYKKIFDRLWIFNKKLKQNKNNLVKQGNWKFLTKIYPMWFTILSFFYVAVLGMGINKGIWDFSYYMVAGWLVLLIILGGILKLILYPRGNSN